MPQTPPATFPRQAGVDASQEPRVVPGPARPGNIRATTPFRLPPRLFLHFSAGGIEFEKKIVISYASASFPFHVPLAYPLGVAQDSAKGTAGIS